MDLRRRKNKPPTQNDSETLKMGAIERILKTVTELYDGGLPGMSGETRVRNSVASGATQPDHCCENRNLTLQLTLDTNH